MAGGHPPEAPLRRLRANARAQVPAANGAGVAYAFYALAGAASLMFAVAPECRRLTGLNPARQQAIETHAEFVARLFVP